ncbi:CAAD domain-containing protein [Cyanobium sp. N5-Cardenillas]|uniref:CAAD domain-containing protein n=1 Tax=Cyanobium sp. N5-Cardenillas TaxID=2823720 RepID=UPI0020CEA8A4|nr:CAAD domain-containing protein [Cyanobium sp. N5-Cardenillas]MCP9785684.1 hypothetical protein [Cyanobium sp. N5-Cardenillas]
MAETPFSPEPPSSPEPQENGPSTPPWTTEAAEVMPDPVSAGPEPEADAPEPAATPVNEPEPGITAIVDVPPLEGSPDPAADGGGEFELLLQKIRDWLGSGELQAQWQRFRGPLKGLAILIGVVLLLRVYTSLIGTLDSLPLVGGLLELVGLIAAVRFTITKMVRKSDREQVFTDWSRRWNDFRGRE